MKVHLTDCSDLCSAIWGVKLKERRSALRSTIVACAFALLVIVNVVPRAAAASHDDDLKALQKLDTDYQRAVEQNDTQTMARILAEDFILVLGDGQVSTKADLLKMQQAAGQNMSIRSIPIVPSACGATQRLLPRSSGPRAWKTESRSTTTCGSAIRTCELPMVGVTFLDKHLFRCRGSRSARRIDGGSRNFTPTLP